MSVINPKKGEIYHASRTIFISLFLFFIFLIPTITFAQSSNSCTASDSCFDFEYNGYTRNTNNTVTLLFTIITNCSNDLSHVAFELPAGVTASNLNNQNSAFKYTFENPTFSPFYSVKFEAKSANGYNNGVADQFSYTIPASDFDNMTSIQVEAKAANSIGTVSFSPKGCCNQQVSISGSASVCTNSTQTYSVAAISGVSTYIWSVPAGWTIVNGQGTRTLRVTTNNQSGNIRLQQGLTYCGTKAITVKPATQSAPVSILGPAVICSGSTQTFEVAAVSGATYYNWTVPAGWQIMSSPVGSGYGRQISVKAGTSAGNISVSASNSCVNSSTITKNITIEPQVTIGSVSGNFNPCEGSTQTYSVTGNATTYNWTIPAGYTYVSGQGSNSITVITGSINGLIQVSAQSSLGCSTVTTSATVTSQALPSITLHPQNKKVAPGANVTFSANATGSNLTYQWQINNGSGWVNINQANAAALQISNVNLTMNGFQYQCLVSGCSQTLATNPALLEVAQPGVIVNLKVLLEGPYNATTGLMENNLNGLNHLPVTQPYSTQPWNYTGTESVSSSFFAANPAIIDWVLIELRSALTPNTKISSKACFLKNDGTLVDLDGQSFPEFSGTPNGDYYVVVNHRNHLPIISKNKIALYLSGSSQYDFTDYYNKSYGWSPLKKLPDNKWGLYAGDADGSGSITTSDWNIHYRNEINKQGYLKADWNLDGDVNSLDYVIWKNNGGINTQVLK